MGRFPERPLAPVNCNASLSQQIPSNTHTHTLNLTDLLKMTSLGTSLPDAYRILHFSAQPDTVLEHACEGSSIRKPESEEARTERCNGGRLGLLRMGGYVPLLEARGTEA